MDQRSVLSFGISIFYCLSLLYSVETFSQVNREEKVIDEIKKLENTVKEWGIKYGHPGAEILVTDSLNNILYHTAFGSVKKNEEFVVASATKPFTFGIILILISEGKLSFDTKVNKYIPNVHPDVTIEMLLSHESGYTNDFDDWFHGKDFESVLSQFVNKGPTAIMGYHIYAEDNSFMLAKIIELVTGMTYDVAWIEKICKPLGLKDTYGKLPNDYFNSRPFYLQKKDTIVEVNFLEWRKSDGVRYIHPSAGLFSTAQDYAKFLNGFKNLIDKDVFDQATRQQNNKEYGYGFQVFDDVGLYGHSGASGFAGFTNGEYTFIFWSPTILDAGRWKKLLRNSRIFTPKAQKDLKYYKELLPLDNRVKYLDVSDRYLGDYRIKSQILKYHEGKFSLVKEGNLLKRIRGNRLVDYWARIESNEFMRINPNKQFYYPGTKIIWDQDRFKIYSIESPEADEILILEAIKR